MLPQRLLADAYLRHGHHVTMLTGGQTGVEQASSAAGAARRGEPLRPPRRPAIDHVERSAAPKLQRPPERHRRPIELAIDNQGVAPPDQLLERSQSNSAMARVSR